MKNTRGVFPVDAIEAPGCPNGSLFVLSYLMEKRPKAAKFLVPDAECVAALRYVLPHLGYKSRASRSEKGWLVEVERT